MVTGTPENRVGRKAVGYFAAFGWYLEQLVCAGRFQANRSVRGAKIRAPAFARPQASGDVIGAPAQRDRIINAAVHC